MKHTLAALLVVTALSAAPVLAQTNPTSASGVVVSSTTESLVIRLDDGTQRTYKVDTTTMLPSGRLAEGKRINVRYQPVDGGLFRAEDVTLVEVTTDRPEVSSTPDRSRETDPIAVSATSDRSRATESTDARVSSSGRSDSLPATASPMPLLALVGCGGLVAALAASKARRNS